VLPQRLRRVTDRKGTSSKRGLHLPVDLDVDHGGINVVMIGNPGFRHHQPGEAGSGNIGPQARHLTRRLPACITNEPLKLVTALLDPRGEPIEQPLSEDQWDAPNRD
jgi:hypothetical protein